MLIMFNMFVAEGCVICLSNLEKKNLKADTDIPIAPRKPSAELEPEDASDVIQQLLAAIQTSRNRPYLDFLDPSISDENYINHIGVDSLTRKQAITHVTTYSRPFFGENRVISILDDTYFYI